MDDGMDDLWHNIKCMTYTIYAADKKAATKIHLHGGKEWQNGLNVWHDKKIYFWDQFIHKS